MNKISETSQDGWIIKNPFIYLNKIIESTFNKTNIVDKSWGHEEILVNNDEFCGKLLKFNKGAKLSLHYHLLKREVFFLQVGKMIFTYFDLTKAERITKELNGGDAIHIPRGCPHKLEAIEYSVIIEISSHHEDSDSYRIEKSEK